ncbi:MAG: hypothetical protein HLX50_08135, partial [Alteromonadaceae bacterium]|nr:hypothetical protein [Alteromonadaceae bacterium]
MSNTSLEKSLFALALVVALAPMQAMADNHKKKTAGKGNQVDEVLVILSSDS